MSDILSNGELSEIAERIAGRFPHDDHYDHELLSIVICQECNGAIDDHKANCIVPEIHRLTDSYRALAGERDKLRDELAVADDALETQKGWQAESRSQVSRLESACEAALTHLKITEHDMPVVGYEQRRDLVKQLEGAIKNG